MKSLQFIYADFVIRLFLYKVSFFASPFKFLSKQA